MPVAAKPPTALPPKKVEPKPAPPPEPERSVAAVSTSTSEIPESLDKRMNDRYPNSRVQIEIAGYSMYSST
jgi:hypothetical protein